MKKYKFTRLDNNQIISKQPIDLMSYLNLNYLEITNKTYYCGEYDFPMVFCNTKVYPDYIALYSERKDYHKTSKTCVAFFEYDNVFDGQHGLYNAIYYKNLNDLSKYKRRFEGVRFFIHPEYSLLGDLDENENIYRLKKSRVVGAWLSKELSAVSIPLVTFPSINRIYHYLSGLERTTVVAISTKSHIQDPLEYMILCKEIQILVSTLPLKAIIVYDVCGNKTRTLRALEPAFKNGIKIVIPNNSLGLRNKERWSKNHAKQ